MTSNRNGPGVKARTVAGKEAPSPMRDVPLVDRPRNGRPLFDRPRNGRPLFYRLRRVAGVDLESLSVSRRAMVAVKLGARSHEAVDFGISVRTLQSARLVARLASPTLLDAVERGDIGVGSAVWISRLSPADQAEVVQSGRRAMIDEVKRIAAERRARRARRAA